MFSLIKEATGESFLVASGVPDVKSLVEGGQINTLLAGTRNIRT